MALHELPNLNSKDEDWDRAYRQCPFPCDCLVLENACVEMRDIYHWEYRDGTNYHRIEEKFILIDLQCQKLPLAFSMTNEGIWLE